MFFKPDMDQVPIGVGSKVTLLMVCGPDKHVKVWERNGTRGGGESVCVWGGGGWELGFQPVSRDGNELGGVIYSRDVSWRRVATSSVPMDATPRLYSPHRCSVAARTRTMLMMARRPARRSTNNELSTGGNGSRTWVVPRIWLSSDPFTCGMS